MNRLGRARNRLPRRSSLKHHKWIRALFDRSQPGRGSLAVGCIRLVFRRVNVTNPSEVGRVFVGFSPGPRIKGSVRRNRVKRLLRECYRYEHATLSAALPAGHEALTLMVVYRGEEPLPAVRIRNDTRQAVALLAQRLSA